MRIKNYIRRSVYLLILTSIIMLMLTAFGQSTQIGNDPITVTSTGYPITIGTRCEVIAKNSKFNYTVIQHEDKETTNRAIDIVKKWWNNDNTFKTPKIIWITVPGKEVRGFQDSEYIFLDPDSTKNDLLATAVHETIHLQNPLPQNMIGENQETRLMEAIVEGITIDLLGEKNVETPTINYTFFKGSYVLYENKKRLYDSFKTGKDELASIFGNKKQLAIQTFQDFDYVDHIDLKNKC